MKQYTKTFYDIFKVSIFLLLMVFVLVGCKNGNLNEHTSSLNNGEISEVISEEKVDTVSYEGEWNRTDVASYEWARITISNWVENESFDVILDATYSYYSGTVRGTAQFITPNTAVLYDEDVMDIYEDSSNDCGVYFKFENNKIIVTHDNYLRMWFGGGGIATAEGTYIQGTPEYINSYDVTELYSEQELEEIKKLLGEDYEYMFVFVVEYGVVEEVEMEGGRYYKAYIPPYGAERCNILIYDDGNIYIDGSNYDKTYWFYSNTDATEMPVIE